MRIVFQSSHLRNVNASHSIQSGATKSAVASELVAGAVWRGVEVAANDERVVLAGRLLRKSTDRGADL